MLTDSEVDRRFLMLVAGLSSRVRATEGPGVTDSAEGRVPDRENQLGSDAGVVGLRVLAVAIALVTLALGVLLARTFDLGILLIFVWLPLVVPGVTLGSVMLVDRLRRAD
jgi:hypothetical protein